MNIEIKLFIVGFIFFVIAMFMLLIKKKIKSESAIKTYKTIYSWVDTIWVALIAASFIMFFFLQAFKIPSGSMRNTLLEGDHLFVNKFIYGFHIPFSDGKRVLPVKQVKRGDIVVFQCPPEALTSAEKRAKIKKDYIKRCVAVAGDKVEIKDKKLYINDAEVKEPYVIHGDNNIFPGYDHADYQKAWQSGKFMALTNRSNTIRDNFGPVIVPEKHYMMLGDNRDFSLDCRFFGPLADKYIKGEALFLYWPVQRWRLIN